MSWKVMLCVCLLAMLHGAEARSADHPAAKVPALQWDDELLSLPLQSVSIRADSLVDAWTTITQQRMLRVGLYVRDHQVTSGEFRFERSSATLKDVLDALVATYSDFTWQQDGANLIWILPKGTPMRELLARQISVTEDQYGLPLLAAILLPLRETRRMNIGFGRLSAGVRNTFNFPVDVHAGTNTIRDFLDLAAGANATKTFYVYATARGEFITPANLVSDANDEVPDGVRLLWRMTVGGGEVLRRANLQNQLAPVLSSKDAERRRLARWVLEASLWLIPFDEWVLKHDHREEALWIALALTDILVRDAGATELAALQRMTNLADENLIATGDAALALFVSLELFRIGKQDWALRTFSSRQLSTSERDQLAREWGTIAAIVARSAELREMLKQGDQRLRVIDELARARQASVRFDQLQFEVP